LPSCSLPGADRYRPLDMTPQRKKEKTFEAWLRQLECFARQQPIILLFEDLHWLDPSSGELLDLLIERIAGTAHRHVPPGLPAALDRPAAGYNLVVGPAQPAAFS
jgi:predicted ATPase